jgi:hypothetical protein
MPLKSTLVYNTGIVFVKEKMGCRLLNPQPMGFYVWYPLLDHNELTGLDLATGALLDTEEIDA